MLDQLDSQPPTAFASLATVRRGDPAPSWLASAVHRMWDLDPAATTLRLIAVSENATFRIEIDGCAHAVLRLHRPGYVADPRQIAGELSWVQAIARDTDVAVPSVHATATGDLVAAITSPDGVLWYAVCFGWVEGTVLESVWGQLAAPEEHYRQIGATTARLHDHAEQWARPEDFTRFAWTRQDVLGLESRWGDWRRADLTQDQVHVLEQAEDLACRLVGDRLAATTAATLIHADLRPSNIMVDGAGALVVIDFDDCGTSTPLWDFASALTFIEHEAATPRLAKAWVEGYCTERDLSDADIAACTALSMTRRLQMLGWTTTHRSDALPADIWDAQVPGSVAVAERFLSDPRWLLH